MSLQPTRPDHLYCAICSALAAGTCASCRAPVCAECSELVRGGATTFAVCERCGPGAGRSLFRAWAGLLWPVLAIVLIGVVVLVVVLATGPSSSR